MAFPRLKNLAFGTISVVLSLVVLDWLLHGVAWISPRIDELTRVQLPKIEDQRLGHRLNPLHPEHDAQGFRNARLYPTADIVALGDSQTYGSGAEADEAWPRVLEALINRPVYSMATGGYGPVHSLILWDDAAQLKPSMIIEAVYAGNDLYDAFTLVYNDDRYPSLKTQDPSLLARLRELEDRQSIKQQVGNMYRRGRQPSPLVEGLKDWLDAHSRVWGILRQVEQRVKQARAANKPERTTDEKWARSQRFAEKYSDYALAWSNSQIRTVFTSEYRLAALDLNDPRIAEGERLIHQALGQMQRKATSSGIPFLVLFIPTKELVFEPFVEQLNRQSYRDLIVHEKKFWQSLRDDLEAQNIVYLDSLPALREQLSSGPQPYKVSHNGHPNATGYRRIAEFVAQYLKTHQPNWSEN